ncbi:MAG: leucine--tRNA ligase [Candidatus Paceibacterota bacterium]
MAEYDHKKIEKKWREFWAKEDIYKSEEDSDKPKSYILDMFPYPSGKGLHVGHPKGYIATDVYSRHMRMKGHQVLHPMGWDAFGLPAENYAIKNQVHPRKAVEKNIARYKEQLENIGFDYDWDREINTTDPEYYKWTQWIFLQLFKKGLAYESHAPINWCPSCRTGLANEDLEGGVCERCGSEIEKRPIRQWMLRITDYADRLLEDLKELPKWPDNIKEMQRNWIGKKEGTSFVFELKGIDGQHNVEVFTTRPDTFFGVTFLVVSPEKAREWIDKGWKADSAIEEYVDKSLSKSEIERANEEKEKTGVDTGIKAIHPATGEEIPVWVADYVLGGYGTGAIMAVPAHDERDHEFAQKFNLPIRQVIAKEYEMPWFSGNKDDLIPVRGSYGIIRRKKDNKILLQIAHLSRTSTYRLPGGTLDEGETWEEGLIREIEEEVGYRFASAGAEVANTYSYHSGSLNPKDSSRDDFIRHKKAFELWFEDCEECEPSPEEYEVSFEYEWHSPEDALRLTAEDDEFIDEQHILRMYLGKEIVTEKGRLVDSEDFSNLKSDEAAEKITEKYGKKNVNYRLQDWVFSRQRYWGEPIPLIHCEECGVVPVPENELPVTLPEVEAYEPTGTGESPLADIKEWVNTTCPECGGEGKRETNTMPQWAGSCWYYLRYMDPRNESEFVDPSKEQYWSPVDVYVGGAEHATRHLIYARFWHKFLYDIGVVSTNEPFTELHSVGLIQAADGRKMSKRFGNVVNPDDIVEQVGADTLRVYEMFMGPFENTIAWSTDNMVGARRFLERVWGLSDYIQDEDNQALDIELHTTIKKVGNDIIAFKFNTAVSQMMIFVKAVEEEKKIGRDQIKTFLRVLAPFASHLTEELWHTYDGDGSIHLEAWPEYDQHLLEEKEVTIVVQIDGKVRHSFSISSGLTRDELKEKAHTEEEVQQRLEGREVEKVIVVPDRLVNFVTK